MILAQLTADVWPVIEKGGMVAGLCAAVVFLVRWVQASQAKLLDVLMQTVDRNTEALREVRTVLHDCRNRNGTGDTSHLRKPQPPPYPANLSDQ